MTFQTGDWVWSRETQQAGQVLDQQTLWGQTVVRVWFPDQATVRSIPAAHLQPVAAASSLTAEAIQYRAAAGRVAHALSSKTRRARCFCRRGSGFGNSLRPRPRW